MAVKRMIAKRKDTNNKYKSCLNCASTIKQELKDNTVYTCEKCGQKHYVDVYEKYIHITVMERPELRHRPGGITPEQHARRELIKRVEQRRAEQAQALKEKTKER